MKCGLFSSSGSEEKEKTLAMIKPDGLLGNYTERIKEVIMDYGFSILREITAQLDQDSASSFYAEHSSRSFFPSLIKYMTRYLYFIFIIVIWGQFSWPIYGELPELYCCSCKVLNWIFLRIFQRPKTKKIVAFVCVFQAFRQCIETLNLALWIVIFHCINGLWFCIPSWHSSCCWLLFEWRRNLLSFFCFVICWLIAFDSGPVLVMVLEKENAIADWRTLIGPTDACKAKITRPNRLFTYKLLFLKPLPFIAL